MFGRHYFQLLASSNTLAQGFYGIIRDFNWRKVSLITQNEIVFVKVRIYNCMINLTLEIPFYDDTGYTCKCCYYTTVDDG